MLRESPGKFIKWSGCLFMTVLLIHTTDKVFCETGRPRESLFIIIINLCGVLSTAVFGRLTFWCYSVLNYACSSIGYQSWGRDYPLIVEEWVHGCKGYCVSCHVWTTIPTICCLRGWLSACVSKLYQYLRVSRESFPVLEVCQHFSDLPEKSAPRMYM